MNEIEQSIRTGERVRVRQNGVDVAAVIPIEDLEFLEQVEEDYDVLEAMEAIDEVSKGGKLIPWEVLRAELLKE
ncbi:MAG: prevent-host-death family protein [Thermodesulfobacteriota bacterium]